MTRARFGWLAACVCLAFALGASAQQKPKKLFTFKAAVVALTSDPALRADFERGLVAKGREHRYNVVTSYDLVPDVESVQDKDFMKTLNAKGIKTVMIVRPAAVGPGVSFDAIKDSVSPAVLADMRTFAKDVSSSGSDELIALVHLGIYMIDLKKPQLVNSGAVWLDEPVQDRAEGIARLQDLIIANLDAARPEIRERLGMPPLPELPAPQ